MTGRHDQPVADTCPLHTTTPHCLCIRCSHIGHTKRDRLNYQSRHAATEDE